MLVNKYMLIYILSKGKKNAGSIYVCIYIKNYMLVNMYMLIYILSKGKWNAVNIYMFIYIKRKMICWFIYFKQLEMDSW